MYRFSLYLQPPSESSAPESTIGLTQYGSFSIALATANQKAASNEGSGVHMFHVTGTLCLYVSHATSAGE